MKLKTIPTFYIKSAAIKKDQPEEMILAPYTPGWIIPLLFPSLLFLVLVVLILFNYHDSFFPAFFIFMIPATTLYSSPVQNELTIHFFERNLHFHSLYLARWPFIKNMDVPFSQITDISRSGEGSAVSHRIILSLADGSQIVLNFGSRKEDALLLYNRLFPYGQIQQNKLSMDPPSLTSENNVGTYEPVSLPVDEKLHSARLGMVKNIKSWSLWFFFSGFSQFFIEKGFSFWGVTLLLIGGMAYYFNEASMMIVFSAMMINAGVDNLIYGNGAWKFFSLIQFFIAFLNFQSNWRYRKIEKKAQEGPVSDGYERSSIWFPWFALGLGVFSFAGSLITFIIYFIGAFLFHLKLLGVFLIILTICLCLSKLGIAVGLAGWICPLPKKWASITGLIFAILLRLVIIILNTINLTGAPSTSMLGRFFGG